MLYSLAMLLDVSADELALELPDGMEKTWKDKTRGHHINELVAVALLHKVALVKFDFNPLMAPTREHEPIKSVVQPPVENCEGLIYGLTRTGMHMVAWDGKQVFNPTGAEIITPLHFYLKVKYA